MGLQTTETKRRSQARQKNGLPLTTELVFSREAEKTIKDFLEHIDGTQIEQSLIELAKIGGTLLPPAKAPVRSRAELRQNSPEPHKKLPPQPQPQERYSVSRLALSEQDMQARVHLQKLMHDAGMIVTQHPLGLIGTYPGKNPSLPAVGMLSHFDSVPNAGMYDGTVGVLSAIHIVQQLKKNNITPNRTIQVIACTGEESARFNMALFGSKGMASGLSAPELAMQDAQGISIRQALRDRGFNPDDVTRPLFKTQDFLAIVELHVAQDNRHPDKLVVVEAIAAPERYALTIGDTPLEPLLEPLFEATEKTSPTPSDIFLTLTVNGTAGHSGATPMGLNHRNDGLVLAANATEKIIKLNQKLAQKGIDASINLSNYTISGAAMNKIPGVVTIPILIRGSEAHRVQGMIAELVKNDQKIEIRQEEKVAPSAAQTKETAAQAHQQAKSEFYDPTQMQERQLQAIKVIQIVQTVATRYAPHKCVGTVSTYTTQHGRIRLGIDLRGIATQTRQKMVATIKREVKKATGLVFGSPLPGSSQPITMDKHLVATAHSLTKTFHIAPSVVDFSPAGHDIQNPARKEIPSCLIFTPSPNGISHHPDEYTSAQDLENGAQALAAFVLYHCL